MSNKDDLQQAKDKAMANAWHMNSAKRDLQLVGPANPGYFYQPCIPDKQAYW